ncbi:DUF6870 family protein [Anaerotignum sp.]|uniref:DUF6870 family protein n=1 Tax=Anaerotignum sp. TaxID=2039241 RepID=UPI0028A6F854|nr:hypothetical protein [Anaerotignum sp.]
MITSKELGEMKSLDATKVDLNELVDIRTVEVQIDLPKEERVADFIQQIKNPYLFKCGNIVVESVFSETDMTLVERIKQYLRMSR